MRSACLDLARTGREIVAVSDAPAAAWVACIAIVFARYGHRIAPAQIVQDAYGTLAAVPAGGGYSALCRPLDRMWTDDGGAMFRIACESLYDASVAGTILDPAGFVQSLAAGDPIVIWAGARPVVLTSLEIAERSGRWTIRSARVVDPVPGIGTRIATETEQTFAHPGPASFAMRVTFPGLG